MLFFPQNQSFSLARAQTRVLLPSCKPQTATAPLLTIRSSALPTPLLSVPDGGAHLPEELAPTPPQPCVLIPQPHPTDLGGGDVNFSRSCPKCLKAPRLCQRHHESAKGTTSLLQQRDSAAQGRSCCGPALLQPFSSSLAAALRVPLLTSLPPSPYSPSFIDNFHLSPAALAEVSCSSPSAPSTGPSGRLQTWNLPRPFPRGHSLHAQLAVLPRSHRGACRTQTALGSSSSSAATTPDLPGASSHPPAFRYYQWKLIQR